MRLYVGAAAVAVLALFGLGKKKTEPTLHVAPALVKIRADAKLPKEATPAEGLDLVAARGECELGQIVASATEEPIRRFDVRAFPLVRKNSATQAAGASEGGSGREAASGSSEPSKAPPPADASAAERETGKKDEGVALIEPSVYRQAFLRITEPSNTEGGPGLWPDPLVPVKDSIVGEHRRAFPVEVPAKQHQPVLLEVCVPRNAAAGEYAGELQALRDGQEWMRVPVRLSVREAIIPATSTMPVTFGLSGRSLLFGHYGEKREKHRLELVERYAKNALAHRISLHGMSYRPPKTWMRGDSLEVDFKEWDAEIGPFLDGTASPEGARFTAIDLRTPEGLETSRHAEYYRRVEAHFREKGWIDRLFAYVMDEPKPEQHEELRRRLRALAAAPGIRRLVTTSIQPDLVGLVDIWTPNINCLFQKEKPDEYCHAFAPRRAYETRERSGEHLWWYQSCSSHGCNHGPFGDAALDRYFSGWPRYLVDAEPAASRIMGWLAFAEGVGGELYFDMVYAYNGWEKGKKERRDPWESVHHFGGNGDGTLYYPGRPDVIGGTTHVPVESLRLKYIRDGLEDYELLRMLAATGEEGARKAKQLARDLASAPFDFTPSPSDWARARRSLFAALDDASKAGAEMSRHDTKDVVRPTLEAPDADEKPQAPKRKR